MKQVAILVIVCLNFSHGLELTARGLVAPVFTQVNDDQSIDYEDIPMYAEYLASNNINSILVGGSTGEHPSLSVEDRKSHLDAWVAAAARQYLTMIYQVGGAPFPDVMELTRYSATLPLAGILTLPELYFKPQSVAELVRYVARVAAQAPNMPVVYYHIPDITGVDVDMKKFVLAASEQIPNFMGIKYSFDDLNEAIEVKKLLRSDQELYLAASAASTLVAPALLMGIQSFIGTGFNIFPDLAARIVEAVDRSDVAGARDAQQQYTDALNAVTNNFTEPFVPSLKMGMELLTDIPMGPPLLPQSPYSTEARELATRKLEDLGLL